MNVMKPQDLTRSSHSAHRYGLLASAGVALLLGIGVFAATHNVVLGITCAVPLGVTLGVAFSESASARSAAPKRKALLALALLVGVSVLVVLGVLAT